MITWDDIARCVGEFVEREGGRPSPWLYKLWGDMALATMSRVAPLKRGEWTTTGSPPLTVQGNTVTIPADCVRLKAIYCDGRRLFAATEDELDQHEPGWQTQSGLPTRYVLYNTEARLNGSADGHVITATGWALIGTFDDDPSPLQYVPAEFQMLPADYIVSRLPVTPVSPVSQHALAVSAARMETERRLQARAEAAQRWETGLRALADLVLMRTHEEFRY